MLPASTGFGLLLAGVCLSVLACGSSSGGSGHAAGGSANNGGSNGVGGQTQCQLADCPQGMQLDAQACRCVAEVVPLPESGSWKAATTEGASPPRVGHSVIW